MTAAGWMLALALSLELQRLRRRLELVARAEHELRGPATALGLAVERMSRDPAERGHALALEVELERLRAGVADLVAARQGRRGSYRPEQVALERLVRGAAAAWRGALEGDGRELRLQWSAGPVAVTGDRGRLAQALGNLMANAAEHGHGPVRVSGHAVPGGVRVEVRNGGTASGRRGRRPGRGRGLRIAAEAAETSGGRLGLASSDEETSATLELPRAEGLEGPMAA